MIRNMMKKSFIVNKTDIKVKMKKVRTPQKM